MDGSPEYILDSDDSSSDGDGFVLLPGRCSQEVSGGGACDSVTVMPAALWTRPSRSMYLTMAQHANLIADAEGILRYLIAEQNYDSVRNLLAFYDDFAKKGMCLRHYMANFNPVITQNKTCVGLSLELVRRWKKMDKKYASFATSTALVSCDEETPDIRSYLLADHGPSRVKNANKNHVLVCVWVVVEGRVGVLLADLGYHISRVVTVMRDRNPPHTGAFRQSETPTSYKEFSFQFNFPNHNYVEFIKRSNRNGTVKSLHSLIYVAQPYLSFLTVTEKRNLVIDFRAMIARTSTGHMSAGLYFSLPGSYDAEQNKDLTGGQFTIFSDTEGVKCKSTYPFELFKNLGSVPKSVREEIETCGVLLDFKKNELLNTISRLSHILSNEAFMSQVLKLNDELSPDLAVFKKRSGTGASQSVEKK